MSSRIVFPGEFETIMNRWINRKRYDGQDNHSNQYMLSDKQTYIIVSILTARSKIKFGLSFTNFSIQLPNFPAIEISGKDITEYFRGADHSTWKILMHRVDKYKKLAFSNFLTESAIHPISHNFSKEEIDTIGMRLHVKLYIYDSPCNKK
jgi:hypothetical protein